MRKLSRTMIGLALGAAIIIPAMAQAQERGRERGFNWQRGGQQSGAMVNGDARREAVRQGREATRAVERPAPAAPVPQASVAPDSRRGWQRGGDGRTANDARRERTPNVADNRQRDWNRGDRDARSDRTERVDRNDNNQRWSSDRRTWDRNGRDDRNRWDRDDRNGRDHDRDRWAGRDRNGRDHDRWNRDWRNDRRYDWRDYRDRNRRIYRLPRYEAPRWGYSYRRWSPGYRWDPLFYSSSYWISDPWYYRLPPAYGDYRWVRYYDDAVLVDIRTGEIVDIIYSFFF